MTLRNEGMKGTSLLILSTYSVHYILQKIIFFAAILSLLQDSLIINGL